MRQSSTGLIGFYERCINWMRAPGRSGSRRRSRTRAGHAVQPVRVNLVNDDAGTTTFGQGPSAATLPAPASESQLSHPFRSNLARASSGITKAWSFNQTVLLSRRRRSSSLLVWTAVGSVSALTLWAITAPLAETIAVQGKLEPGSSTKRIDAPVPGVVEAVLVREGQQVRKGMPLVRFDLREPRSKLAAAEAVRQRLIQENLIAAATLGDGVTATGLSANQRQQLASQSVELATRREGVRQELAKSDARLSGLRNSLITYQSIAQRYAGLVAQGAASEVQLLEARQRVQDTQARINEEQREAARLSAGLVNTGAATSVELRRKVEENLRQITQIDNDIRLARQQIQYGLLTAPADGTVFDIEVGAGSVVAQGTGNSATTGSKPLMKVVPQDALQARVYVPNQAIGFVRPGLKARLSIDAFRASDFGTVPARVIRIGSDALTAEEQSRELGRTAEGLYYPAMLSLDRQDVDLQQRKAPLQAGMTVTADITLRERRFINILTGFLEDQRRNLERLR